MRPWAIFAMAAFMLSALAIPVQAATTALASIPSSGECSIGPFTASVAAIALGANAGSVDVSFTYPCHALPVDSAGPFGWSVNVDGPQLLAGGVAGTTHTLTRTYTGCTVSGTDTANADISVLTDHYTLTSLFTFNAGSTDCNVDVVLTTVIATTATVHFRVVFDITRELNYKLDYICDHSTVAPLAFNANTNTCATANLNVNVTNFPDLKIAQWPSLQTTGQSHRSGGLQFEGSPERIDVPYTSTPLVVPIEYMVRVPAGTYAVTSMFNTPPLVKVAGGNAICIADTNTTISTIVSPTGDTEYSLRRFYTFDADYCGFTSTVGLLNGATTVAQVVFDHVIRRTEHSTDTVINSGTQHLVIDSWPTLIASLSGTVTLAGGVTISGTLDNLNRFCAASATGTACTTPVVNLGGAITVHNDGTISVVNSGGQTMTVAGTLSLSQSGIWTITNAGGQSISFTGPLTIHQDPICTAAAHCHIDTNGNFSLVGNSTSTQNLNIPPGFWELFGPLLLAVGFVAALSVAGIWIAPGGAALGMAIFLHAFKQPYPFLVLLQAVAGISLAIFCLIAIAIRVLNKKPKEPRRFFT